MTQATCPACGNALVTGMQTWHLVCKHCGYEGSTLEPDIAGNAESHLINEVAREHALSTLRHRNFSRIVAQISLMVQRRPVNRRPRLLDVGCAHGWFMQACSSNFDVVGIEPDGVVAEATRKRVEPIRQGFFPDVLQAGEMFDVIVFNDVLEHIPNVRSAMRACQKHLAAGGLLVINAPCRNGGLYRIAKFMARCGWPRSFERMWQLGLPSPHVHYFDAGSISRLGANAGLDIAKQISLPSVVATGLYSRIWCSGQMSRAMAVAIAGAVLFIMPILRVLPSDIEVWFLQ